MLALAGGFMLLGRGQSSSSAAVPVIKPLHPVKKHVAKTAAPKAKAHGEDRAKAKTAVKPPRSRWRQGPKVHVPAVIDGMPSALALAPALPPAWSSSRSTRPTASVDSMATDEARHGALAAHVGFVAFNVADEKIVSPLSSLLTGAPTPADRVLDGPAVLVFVSARTASSSASTASPTATPSRRPRRTRPPDAQ